MIHDDQDIAVLLRREAATVVPQVRDGQVDDVLAGVFAKRARQRTQRTRLWAIAVVALMVAGTALVGARFAQPDPALDIATTVDQWPLRGELSGNTELLERAERVWRTASSENAPAGPVRPLFAQQSPVTAANMVMVVLAGHTARGRLAVAFVTTPATGGTPNAEQLLVRAVTFPDTAQRAVGFVAATPEPVDVPRGSLAFALGAPGTSDVHVRTSIVDGPNNDNPGDVFWRMLPRGVGAWNSVIVAGGGARWADGGLLDPVATSVELKGTVDAITAQSTTERKLADGDLVVTEGALYGVVTDAGRRVDTSVTAWAARGTARVAGSTTSGALAPGPNNSLLFAPTGQSGLTPGSRVEFVSAVNPEVVVNVGKLVNSGGQWRVHRFLDPNYVPEELMSISPGNTQAK
jgi:hypothetical protein